jgi:glutathione synthase/RimK-type ligase-like ATP-grasp enzyme
MAGARRVGILWRGDPSSSPTIEGSRFEKVADALAGRGLTVEAVVFSEEAATEISARLRQLDGVMVWVNPVSDGKDRSTLDALLRDVASEGVWVSAHPDVILKMGTKDVLVRTGDMEWGSDCRVYADLPELARDLPGRLLEGPRVLKQYRGNGGEGVWKVELTGDREAERRDLVRVIEAKFGSSAELLSLGPIAG